jgi:hypothetical protein
MSITSMASPSSALTNTRLPSGVNTACSGFLPFTLTMKATLPACVSTKATSLLSSIATASQRPSGDRPTPSGDSPNAIVPSGLRCARSSVTSWLFGWSLTYAMRPSIAMAVPRGFLPAGISATTWSVAVSITLTVPEPSFGT